MSASPGRVLVVDDVEANRNLLTRRLEKLGLATASAAGGAEALAMVEGGGFDVVLLDIMMPGMDGLEVLAQLKADEALRHLPVIMISAVEELETVVRCIELGAEDYLPKPFNPVILRARVGASLDRKRLRDRERLHTESLERELRIGHEIQKGFLPEALPALDGWDLAARFAPATQVAGDFYDAFAVDGGRTMVVVADVCGKGVGSALYMALFRTLIRAAATAAPGDPAQVLERAARTASDYIATVHERSSMFATAFLGMVDSGSGELAYANCGHDAPLVASGGVVRTRLAPTGPALGLLPGSAFGVAREVLAPGEGLLLFTDGVTEAQGPLGFFGEARLLGVPPGGGAGPWLDRVTEALRGHVAGFEPSDDITLLALCRNPRDRQTSER